MVAIRIPFTEHEYLALEAVAEIRHEFLDGDIIGMAGAELDHNQIVQNLRLELGNALRGKPCRVLGGEQRVKLEASREYVYPDVVVTCLEPSLVEPSPRSLTNPQVIIEVLSPTTQARDRSVKLLAYQGIPSLTDYLMVASDRRRVEQVSRGPDGLFTTRILTDGTCSVSGVALELNTIYAQTAL